MSAATSAPVPVRPDWWLFRGAHVSDLGWQADGGELETTLTEFAGVAIGARARTGRQEVRAADAQPPATTCGSKRVR